VQTPNPDAGGRKLQRILIWVLMVLVALPILFYLFEYVVPRLMPANF
jgi:hypothetical protein